MISHNVMKLKYFHCRILDNFCVSFYHRIRFFDYDFSQSANVVVWNRCRQTPGSCLRRSSGPVCPRMSVARRAVSLGCGL